MKKIKRQNPTTKIALFAGATALMALVPQTRADSSTDALLNKLEQKGILTVDEAKELKAENATNMVEMSKGPKFSAPDWVTGYKLNGDFRGRFDDQTGNDNLTSRIRLRYRLRVGLVVSMKDNTEVGFRLGTGDGGPLSNNQTMAGNASKKPIYVDTAYGKWTPINDGTTTLAAEFGKLENPFKQTAMVFDPDYTPEGGALMANYKIDDNQSLAFTGAGFVLDEISKSSRDPFMYGAQAILNSKWTPEVGTSLGIAAYDIVNKANLTHAYDGNSGNTFAGGYAENFNPIVGDASVTYTLDSFPLYPGKFPITLAGEFMKNPGASSNNEGWYAGVTFGKAAKKGTWDISYRYQHLDANAWWDQVVDDDNIAYSGGVVSGTNVKGSLVKFNYAIFDSLTFTFTGYFNSLIHNPSATSSDAIHVMADLMWKF